MVKNPVKGGRGVLRGPDQDRSPTALCALELLHSPSQVVRSHGHTRVTFDGTNLRRYAVKM